MPKTEKPSADKRAPESAPPAPPPSPVSPPKPAAAVDAPKPDDATKTGKLASVGSVDFYTFTGTGGKGWDIVVNAERKQPSSTLDSRLTIWDVTAKKPIITNDNAAGTTDSQIGSPDAFHSGSARMTAISSHDPARTRRQIITPPRASTKPMRRKSSSPRR